MSKIICDVCGTSYPDTATQCPICGCVRSGEAQSIVGDVGDNDKNSGYTYVKGGRFSKSNVRKRNKNTGAYAPAPKTADEPEKSDNKGLVIAAIVLLLAIIAVVIYISVQFFLPGIGSTNDPATNPSQSQQTKPQESEPLKIPCQSLKLDVSAITFSDTTPRIIYPTAEPKNTTDSIVFRSSDEAVVTVDANGLVTPVAPGQAKIIVTCGDVTVECTVECTFDQPSTEEIRLNRNKIEFSKKGDTWVIYNGNVAAEEITWTSDDEAIATIKNGKVEAVGNGTTNVHAEYFGQKVSCVVECKFTDSGDSNAGSGGNITEDGGQSGSYELKNIYGGRNDDVSLSVNESFIMWLVDGSGNKVSGVTWTVSDENICSVSDGLVTGISSGITTVTATYLGVEYSFTVRIR